MYRGTPSRRFGNYNDRHGIYGATANFGERAFPARGAPRGFGNTATGYVRENRFSAPQHSWGGNTFRGGGSTPRFENFMPSELPRFQESPALRNFTPRDTLNRPFQSGPQFVEVDPVPTSSLINRLRDDTKLSTAPDMKHVNQLPDKLSASFEGKADDWFVHVNKLELDVFQKHAFNAMQC